ncbi:hypothetical protein ACLOJK_029451 [Asimina triloba]
MRDVDPSSADQGREWGVGRGENGLEAAAGASRHHRQRREMELRTWERGKGKGENGLGDGKDIDSSAIGVLEERENRQRGGSPAKRMRSVKTRNEDDVDEDGEDDE